MPLGPAPRFPGDRPGFQALGQAPPTQPNPFTSRGYSVEHIRRGPFGGWFGRFRERIGGVPGGQRGDVGGGGRLPGTTTLLPHRVTVYRKAAFWAPQQHYKRQEYLVSPPALPGTAIPYTLFHPVYIPGLQGWKATLPYNYQWVWGRMTNFREWAMNVRMANATTTGRGRQQNIWKPAAKIPQGVGQGQVWQQPRPYYVPNIINPQGDGMGGEGGKRNIRGQRSVGAGSGGSPPLLRAAWFSKR